MIELAYVMVGVYLGFFFGAYLVIRTLDGTEPKTISQREAVRELGKKIADVDLTRRTTYSCITNVFFESNGKECRAVLSVEEKDRWEKRKEKDRDKIVAN